MTRKKKYNLDRALIELENAVEELTDYVYGRAFIEMFDDPIRKLDTLMWDIKRRREENVRRL